MFSLAKERLEIYATDHANRSLIDNQQIRSEDPDSIEVIDEKA